MTDVLDGVRDHYRATGLAERLKTALAALAPDDQQLTYQQLAGLDQFHTRGLAATAELGKLAARLGKSLAILALPPFDPSSRVLTHCSRPAISSPSRPFSASTHSPSA